MSQQQQDETDAAAAEGPEIVSEFPAPPAFFVLYRDGADQGPPPPEPMAPTYHMFGTPYSTQDAVPDLLPQEGRKLYLGSGASGGDSNSDSAAATASTSGSDSEGSGATPESGEKLSGDEGKADLALDERQIDYKGQMKKINRSLLANFVELVDVLTKRPSMFNEKLDDLEQLFLNMHNLINAFRPHQARETIIQMLKAQIQERRDAAQDIRKTIDESRKAVELVHAELHETTLDDASRADAGDVKMEDAESGDASARTHALENGLMSPTGAHAEQSARAREARQLQEDFFDALDTALVG
ncbi:Mediator of RNA polymerase ii transcription subunit [Globisporangium polare]